MEHTTVLDVLTKKVYNQKFLEWTSEYQKAFEAIKQVITGMDCLTSIGYNSGKNIYITTDTSLKKPGAVLNVRKSLEKAWPVAFNSSKYISAEYNYPVHEQEMLMIIWVLKK